MAFEYDLAFVSSKEREIIDSYNAEKGKNVDNIQDVPRSYSTPRLMSLHNTRKMICSTQCIYYLDMFQKAKINAHIIHIQRYKLINGNRYLDLAHDDLIFFDTKENCWKVIDFTGAWYTMQQIKSIFMTPSMSAEAKRILTDTFFDKKLTDLLKESTDHWLAVTYYDGDGQKDLGDLDPALQDCLRCCGYVRAVVEGRLIHLIQRV